jgi:hypothetical protein
MIIGHVGVAFAARWRWPRLPLSALLLATFAPDMLRAVLAAFQFPVVQANFYSHALPWSALLALAAGALAWAALRDGTSSLVIAAVVMSHVALDMLSGNKALWKNGVEGIDLGHVEQVELLLESALLLGGWYFLRRASAPTWLKRWWVPALLIAFQAASLAGSISQRPYASRCLASPLAACTDGSLMTRRWETTPFW